jgi:hypothetical protein
MFRKIKQRVKNLELTAAAVKRREVDPLGGPMRAAERVEEPAHFAVIAMKINQILRREC